MKKIKIKLQLSEIDQAELNYQNPILKWDFENLMKCPFTVSVRDQDIIQAIRHDLSIPDGYLNEYRIVLQENTVLVIP